MTETSVKTSGLTTTGIDHIVLHVGDPEAAEAFYVDVLGMTVDHGTSGHRFLRCGDQVVGLFRAPGGSSPEPRQDLNHLALNVEAGSYDDIRARLEAAGVEVSGRPGDDRCIYFHDPDGNTLQIVVPR